MNPTEYRKRQRTDLTPDELHSAIRWETIRKAYFTNVARNSDRLLTCEALINNYTDRLYGPR